MGTRTYSPYGEVRVANGEDPTLGYQSDLTDPDSELVDMGARQYHPGLGRFTSSDPLQGDPNTPMSMNAYLYGHGDPLTFTDPTGLAAAPIGPGGSKNVGKDDDGNLYIVNSPSDPNTLPGRGWESTTPPPPPAPSIAIPATVYDASDYMYEWGRIDPNSGMLMPPIGHVYKPPSGVVAWAFGLDEIWRCSHGGGCVGLGIAFIPGGKALKPLARAAKWVGSGLWAGGKRIKQGISSLRRSTRAGGAGQRLPWTSWRNYPKVNRGGREYAQIGNRLYTRHAVNRLQPRGLGIPAGAKGPGRSVSPSHVEDVLSSSRGMPVKGPHGEARLSFTSGTVQVITEDGIVVTVITR